MIINNLLADNCFVSLVNLNGTDCLTVRMLVSLFQHFIILQLDAESESWTSIDDSHFVSIDDSHLVSIDDSHLVSIDDSHLVGVNKFHI